MIDLFLVIKILVSLNTINSVGVETCVVTAPFHTDSQKMFATIF